MMFSLQLHRLNVAHKAVCVAMDEPTSVPRVNAALDSCMRAGIVCTAVAVNWQELSRILEEMIADEEDKLMERYNHLREQGLIA